MQARRRNNWNQFPLFRLLLPFMAGIIAGIHEIQDWDTGFSMILIIFLLLMLSGSMFIRSFYFRWVHGAAALILSFFLGMTLVQVTFDNIRKSGIKQYESKQKWLVETLESPVEKENSYKVLVKVLMGDSGMITPERAVLYLEKDSSLVKSLNYGNRLVIWAQWQRPQKPTNPEQFNYRQFLERNGILHQAYVKAEFVQLLEGYQKKDLRGFVFNLRKKLLENLKEYGFRGAEYSIAAAILLGQDNTMDPRLRSDFAAVGAMHILCVSGLHVGVIFLILEQLLRFLNRRKRGPFIKAVLIIIMIWFYAALTGLEPSVLRASTMVSFVVIGKTIRRPTSVYNSLAASAFVLLIIDPLIISQIGFQLSYLAVLSIVAFQPLLYRMWLPRNTIVDKLWAITTVSVAAQLGTFPLAIHYFHIFPLYFLITNLIVIPLSSFIIYAGLLFFFTAFFHPAAWLFSKVLWGLIWFLNNSVLVIESLPSSALSFLNLTAPQILLVYLTIIMVYVWLVNSNRRALLVSLFFLFILSLTFVDATTERLKQDELVIYDAGRGVAMEMIKGDRHVVLMDSATMNNEKFVNYNMLENWVSKGLKMPDIIELSDSVRRKNNYVAYYRNSLLWDNRLFYIMDEANTILEYSPDYLLVNHYRAVPEKCLNNSYPSHVLLTASVPSWNRKKWKTFADTNGIQFHNLSEQCLVLKGGGD